MNYPSANCTVNLLMNLTASLITMHNVIAATFLKVYNRSVKIGSIVHKASLEYGMLHGLRSFSHLMVATAPLKINFSGLCAQSMSISMCGNICTDEHIDLLT